MAPAPAAAEPVAAPSDYVVSSEHVAPDPKLAKDSLADAASSEVSGSEGTRSLSSPDQDELFYKKHGYISDLQSRFAIETYDPETFDPSMYFQPLPWHKQYGLRSAIVSACMLFVLTFITMRGALTVGQSPPLSVPAGLLSFIFVKLVTWCLTKLGIKQRPFTAQENTSTQTCVVAGSALAWGAGFPSALLGLSKQTYEALGPSKGNRLQDTTQPDLQHVAPFMPVVAFTGCFILIGLRKLIMIDFDLPWPSGTAVGMLMNSFHGAHNSTKAMRQVKSMGEWFTTAFLWAFFRWFFTGNNGACGFEQIPFFGFKAKEQQWYYKMETLYIGAGMITPHAVSWSMMAGSIISWGILWPIFETKAGKWYSLSLVGTQSFGGMYGYETLCSIALLMGDALYNMGKVFFVAYKKYKLVRARKRSGTNQEYDPRMEKSEEETKYAMTAFTENVLERRIRLYYFYKDNIPWWFGFIGYVVWVIISTVVIPLVWPQVKWYYVFLIYLVTPPLTLANAYAAGLTDFNISVNLSKIAIFVFAAGVGVERGGLIVGLVLSIVVKCAMYNAVEMMQDFRTGYLTLASPKAMVFAQLFGSVLGCVMSPLCFYILYNAFPVGVAGGTFPAPYAAIYRGIAILGCEGFSLLPKYCLQLCLGFFILGLLLDVARDLVRPKYARFIPYPIAMSLPMVLGTYFAIEYCIGSVAKTIWRMKNPASEAMFMPAVATGLIVGDGIWALPAAILAMVNVQPPICLQYIKAKVGNSAYPNGY